MNKPVIFLIPAILLVTFVSGYYLFVKKPSKEIPTTKTTEQILETPKVTEIATTTIATTTAEQIDTSDWKVYRNEEYGFEVRYPKEWHYLEHGDQVFFDLRPIKEIISDSEPPISLVMISISESKNIEEWIKQLRNTLKFESYKELELFIDNMMAKKVSGKVTGESYITGKYYDAILFNKDNRSYSLTYVYPTLEYSSVFDLIIKNIKFL